MITPSTIYWIGTLDSIIMASSIVGLLAYVVGLIGIGIFVGGKIGQDKDCLRASLWINGIAWPIAILAICIAVFTPSSRGASAMYVVPAIVNNEKVQDVGNKMYDLAIEWMEELKPRSNKKAGE